MFATFRGFVNFGGLAELRVLTRYMGLGIRRVGSGIKSRGIEISSFLEIRDQAVPYLWDQDPKFVSLLESRIRNVSTKMG